MNIDNKYYNLIIDNKFYSFIETTQTPNNQDRIDLLTKIDQIVKHRFQYNPQSKDEFSNLTERDLLKVLDEKSKELCEDYKKQSQPIWKIVFSLFNDQEGKIDQLYNGIHARVENYLNPPQIFPSIPGEIIQHVISYLKISELGKFARLNKHAKEHAERAFLTKAIELGFNNTDTKAAFNYLEKLYSELNILCSKKTTHLPSIFKKNLVQEKGVIDLEATLKKLQNLALQDMLNLISHSIFFDLDVSNFGVAVFPHKYQNFLSFLKKQLEISLKGVNLSTYNFNLNRVDQTALRTVILQGEFEFIEMLLKHGVRLDLSVLNFVFRLESKSRMNINIVKLLLNYGADVNARENNYTPLDNALLMRSSPEMIQLLRENKALTAKELDAFEEEKMYGP